jgi:siroheme synthase-like protein
MGGSARYYPVALDLRDRIVVVVGGGADAEFKVERLLPYGPRLRICSEKVTDAIAALAEVGLVQWLKRDYQPGDLQDASVVFVCDRRFVEAARQEAKARRVLLNALDDAGASDFIAMAGFSRRGLDIAVHSSGQSAALSRRLRERLEREVGEAFGELAALLGELRPQVHRLIPDPSARRSFWLAMVDAQLMEAVGNGAWDPADLEARLLEAARGWPNQSTTWAVPRGREAEA